MPASSRDFSASWSFARNTQAGKILLGSLLLAGRRP